MKLYSNKGKFKKYSITFTCKVCQNDIVNEFYENNKRFVFECIKCKNSICFSYINTLEDTVNPELIKKPDKKDNNKKFDFNEINKHDKELIFNQVNAKFPLNKGNNEAEVKIYTTPSFQPEPKIYKTPNNLDPKKPPNSYSYPKPKIYQIPNQKVNDGVPSPDDIPAPVCENIQKKINNNSDAIKKVKIKFLFNYSNTQIIELNPSISMEQQYDIIQKKFEFKDQKKIYINTVEIDYKAPLSEIKCLDKCTLEISDE